ncbi:outer membrane beta-barrel family protein [Flavobacterium sp. Fl-77]|uniref:Outer membrane beta-barrel family protein n=1 Tax=Flavobacterium flavipigmentatum TaxID=2893884 RepID=A0AAJ2SCU5_9FLAO|nr:MULTISPECIES: outer membrane beta-barrel family protein [unclassified Flavobacterium]MDX6183147.1 outer membrane beta-barrel family protein [Flavobacterium sp. Fl-33]MDX6186784.1 outer membrane beta-barrel family protein [Flavobacterium sp. Fl-77]UFH40438.1 TonB-dependent receptor family protein [Flavobacterium sp. F-70]
MKYNYMPIHYITLLCLLIFLCNPTYAQNSNASISGNVIDAENKEPVIFATILLMNDKQETLIKSELSQDKGDFSFKNLKSGTYKIKVVHDDYNTFKTEIITIKEDEQKVLSPIDVLKSIKKESLNEVIVYKQKKFIESKIDRTILNVDALESNTGITALELLKKAPGTSISDQGVVSLNGKANATIFIDDRPTYLSGAQLESFLSGLSSDNIDKIEIMTNPPAKYEAAGNGGVINIKLKKSKKEGENGSIVLGVRQHKYTEYNTTFNFNKKKENYNIFLTGNIAYKKRFQDLYINRDYTDTGSTSRQETNNVGDGILTNIKFGADYNLSKNTVIGISTNGLIWNGNDKDDSRNYINSSAQVNDSIIKTIGDSGNKFINSGINLNVNHKFNEKSDITANLDYLLYDSDPYQRYKNSILFPDASKNYSDMLVGGSTSNVNIYAGKLDYSNQITKKTNFQTGFKHSYIKTDNESTYFDIVNDITTPNLNQNNKFLYKENITALYVSSNTSFERLSMQLGLRYETVKIEGDQLGNEIKPRTKNKTDYDNFFPTLYLSYKLDSLANNTIGINYGKRIDRPFYQDLNPVVIQVDKVTFYKGNPYLKPSITNSIEASYGHKSLLNVSLAYSEIDDQIQETIEIVNNIYYSVPGNIGNTKVTNLSVSSTFNLTSWLTFSGNVQLSYTDTKSNFFDGKLHTYGYNFRIDPVLQVKLKNDYKIELFGRYVGKAYVAQFTTDPYWFLDITLSKKLSSRSLLKVVCTDVFRTYINKGVINNLVNTNADYKTLTNSRQLRVSFTYNFGDKVSKQEKENTSIDNEKSRIK